MAFDRDRDFAAFGLFSPPHRGGLSRPPPDPEASPMARHPLALALALSAAPAVAQDYNRTDLVRGLCQPDGCDEFAILSAERLTTADEGALFKTRVKTFHASYGGRKETGEENGYVYCSRTKPAVMAEQNGKVLAFYLAPFATQESRESVRRNANFHALYFTICHGMEAGKAAVHNLSGVAGSYGYRVPLAQSKLTALNRAEDVMGPGEPSPVAAQPPERPRSARRPRRSAHRSRRRAGSARPNGSRRGPPLLALPTRTRACCRVRAAGPTRPSTPLTEWASGCSAAVADARPSNAAAAREHRLGNTDLGCPALWKGLSRPTEPAADIRMIRFGQPR
jgi:hypothetical protein